MRNELREKKKYTEKSGVIIVITCYYYCSHYNKHI